MSQFSVGVTGANGYLGSRLVPFLISMGYRVVAFGRGPCTSASSSAFIDLGATPSHNAYEMLSGVDTLIHCAYDYRPLEYSEMRRVNVEGTVKLFEEAKNLGVTRLVYVSSVSAFKDAFSSYGRIKLETERQIAPLGAIVLRPGMLFGKNAGGIVGALSRVASKFPVVPLIGSGNQVFYPCHVNDLCEALAAILGMEDVPKDIPIVTASEIAITFRDMIELFAKSNGKKPLLIPIPYTIIFIVLKIIERLRIRLPFRSDGLVYIKQPARSIDFGPTRALSLTFRPMVVETLGA